MRNVKIPMKIKMHLALIGTLAAASLLPLSASATPGFTGDYATAEWTLYEERNGVAGDWSGFVDTSGAPNSISLTGQDDDSGFDGLTQYTVSAAKDGTFEFAWDYSTLDSAAQWDPFGYVLNGVLTTLFDDGTEIIGDGTMSIAASAGDVFGFYIATGDNTFGAATAVISDFCGPGCDDKPVYVPLPATLALLGFGLLIPAMRRRRR